MITLTKDLEITRGDDRKWSLMLTDFNDVPYDLADWIVFFTVKSKVEDADSDAKIKKNITVHLDSSNGLTVIDLSAADTSGLSIGTYYYDIQVKTSIGKIYTIQKGKFVLAYDVTIRTSAI